MVLEENIEEEKELESIIEGFKEYLLKKNLSEKTLNNHVENINFFGFEYLLAYEHGSILEVSSIDILDFVGHWYIRKVLSSNKRGISSFLTSFKKFYKYLNEKDLIDDVILEEIMETCKDKLHFYNRFDEYMELPSDNYGSEKFEKAWENWFMSY